MKRWIYTALIILVLVLIIVGYSSFKRGPGDEEPEQFACTMDAKMCPDGSYVGRVGPKCEFAECAKIEESNTAKLDQRIFNSGIYLTPLEILSDSRCAEDVACIWAGSVSLKVKLESTIMPGENKEVTLTSNNQVVFADKRITLVSVIPTPNSKKTILPAEYQFNFVVKDTDASVSSLIKVTSPKMYEVVTSPLVITGVAKGNWYFEASFPVSILDSNGKELGVVPAQAQGDWMTTEFVPFKATLKFNKPTTLTGTIVLQKDNPSGLPEYDDVIYVTVKFVDFEQ